MALGYVTAVVLEDNVLASKGDQLKGHEFHYSSFQLDKDEPRAYRLVKEGVSGHTVDGYVKDNVLATYLHIHFAAHPQAAQRLIDSCLRFKKSRETIDGGALRNE